MGTSNSVLPWSSASASATTLLLLLLLILLSLSHSPIAGDANTDVVRDFEGNPVEMGSEYHIIPWGRGFCGGLTRASKPGHLCPQYAIQSSSEIDLGEPVRFIPANETQKEIHLFSDLNIVFGPSFCRSQGLWSLIPRPLPAELEVSADGFYGDGNTNNTLFKIISDNGSVNIYKIIPASVGLPLELGISRDDSGFNMLVFSSFHSEPLVVGFVKKAHTQPYRATT